MRSERQVRSSQILARWIQHDGPSWDSGLGSNDTQNQENQPQAMHRLRGNEAGIANALGSESGRVFPVRVMHDAR